MPSEPRYIGKLAPVFVDTIQALRDFPVSVALRTPQHVFVRGYYSAGDISDIPPFVWRSGASAGTYVDNGMNVIVPTGGDGSSAWEYICGEYNAKWAGVKGDGVADETSRIQDIVDLGLPMFFPSGNYKLTSTIVMRTSYGSIRGSEELPYFHIDPLIGPAFKITTSGGSAINEFSSIKRIAVWADGKPSFLSPSATNCAIAIDGAGGSPAPVVSRTKIEDVRLIGFGTGIYYRQHANTHVERVIIEHHTDWSATTGTGVWYVGHYFDGSPAAIGGISSNASVEVVGCIFNGGFAPSNVSGVGFRAYGDDIRDIFFDRCETYNGNMGFWIQSISSDYNCDVIIRRPICDTFKQAGIYILNVNGPGCVTIDGGYLAPSISSPGTNLACIWVENSRNVNIGGVQILGFNNSTTTDDGIRVKSSSYVSIVRNSLENLTYGISLQTASFCTVVGNTVSAATTALESAPALNDGIRLFSTSVDNSVIGNIVGGRNASYKYSVGINVSADSLRNNIAGNQVDTATVTSMYTFTPGANHVSYSRSGVALSYSQMMALADGATAPTAISGMAIMYVDAADGDLKVIFGDGTIKTIVTDT